MSTTPLLKVDNLVKHFPITRGVLKKKQVAAVRAVDGISFYVNKGETLGLVGESGCGKSTTGKVIIRLEEPTSGTAVFDGHKIFELSRERMREVRRNLQMVFQDPYASLNPRMQVGEIIAEPLIVHNLVSGKEREGRVVELLETVGLNATHARRYPHEFSGGQRQRIGVARALAVDPQLIICDEPVSALDVSIQAQVINLLQDLQKTMGLTYLFIARDLSVVKHISNRIAVMYLGKIVEMCSKDALFESPKHPYTEALLSAIPVPDPDYTKNRIILEGDVPSPISPPSGCRFHTRCRYAMEICKVEEPQFVDLGGGHYCACHLRKPAKA